MDKKESETEVGADKVNSVPADGKSEEAQKEPFNLKKFLKSFFAAITVEPYLIVYFFSILCTSIANKNFLLEKACRADLQNPVDVCTNMIEGTVDDNITMEATTNASILVAELTAWKDPVQTGIPALYILFVGAWSDRTGNRKAILLIPMIGEFLALVGFMFAAFYMEDWPLWVVGFIEITVAVFTGGFVVALMGCYNYIADVTSEDNRTFRIGVFFFIVKAAGLIAVPIAGYLTTQFGYYGLYGMAMGCYVVGIIYTCLRIRYVKRTQNKGTFWYKLSIFFHPKNVYDTFAILFTSRGIKLAQILLVILAHFVVMGPVAGEGSITFLYTKKVFKMTIVEFSLFHTWSNVVSVIGVAIAATVFSKWLKFHDAAVGLIATTSNVASSLLYGLAPTTLWFYIGAGVDIFGNSGGAAIRSLGTKLVHEDNIGKMCSLLGFADSLMPSIYIPLFNKVLSKCLKTGAYLGSVFIMGAVMTSPAFILLGVLYGFHRKLQKDAVRHPEVKEMHVYDNEMVSHM